MLPSSNYHGFSYQNAPPPFLTQKDSQNPNLTWGGPSGGAATHHSWDGGRTWIAGSPGQPTSIGSSATNAALSNQPGSANWHRLLGVNQTGVVPERPKTHAKISLQGFEGGDKDAMRYVVGAVSSGLGQIFPDGHNDILIINTKLTHKMAQTDFYGKEAMIMFDLQKHAKNRTDVMSEECLARMAQTLTHEIVLHTLKEFSIYAREKRFVRTGSDGHRDACLPDSRDWYLGLSLDVVRYLKAGKQQNTFITEWRYEIEDLANDPATQLSSMQSQDAISWSRGIAL